MRRRWRQRRDHHPADINITAFMNLMVILVPFLLITAVFSRMTILELSLPGPGTEKAETEPALVLEVTVREARIEVGDRNTGILKTLDNGPEGYDLAGLSAYLQQVKVRFPDKLDATLLLEPDIDYDTLVQVMDTVRVAQGENAELGELFPEISIGDAVLLPATSAAGLLR